MDHAREVNGHWSNVARSTRRTSEPSRSVSGREIAQAAIYRQRGVIKRDMTFLALNGARDARPVGSPTSGERRYENRSKIIVKFIRRDHYAWTSFSHFTPDDRIQRHQENVEPHCHSHSCSSHSLPTVSMRTSSPASCMRFMSSAQPSRG